MPRYRWSDVFSVGLRMFSRAWLVCGTVALFVGSGFALYQAAWISRSVPARGTIVALVPVHDPYQKTPTFAPRFTYRSGQGQSYTVTSGIRSKPGEFEAGERVPVRYLRSRPSSARLDEFWQLWVVPFVCLGLGIFFTLTGYLLIRLERWWLQRSAVAAAKG